MKQTSAQSVRKIRILGRKLSRHEIGLLISNSLAQIFKLCVKMGKHHCLELCVFLT